MNNYVIKVKVKLIAKQIENIYSKLQDCYGWTPQSTSAFNKNYILMPIVYSTRKMRIFKISKIKILKRGDNFKLSELVRS